MSKTSSLVKNRYNDKVYDIIRFHAPKGFHDRLKAVAKEAGESVAEYIRKALNNRMGNQ